MIFGKENRHMTIQFTKNEIQAIYDTGVSFLENMYRGDYEDIDLAYEPVKKFDAEEKEIKLWQSIIVKIGGP